MSASRSRGRGSSARQQQRDPTDYEVGYGRPPKRTQFKPGRSGNPKGRPKGTRNEATIWLSVFNKKVTIREGGKNRTVSLLEAMILKFAEDAVRGNTKTAAFALNRYRLAQGDVPTNEDVDQDDREVFDAFVRRVEANAIAKKRK